VESDNLVVKIESTNMAWKTVIVHFILHSRSDVFSEVNVASILENVETAAQSLTKTPAITGSILFVHHVLGIKAVYSASYDFWVQPAQISTGKGQYSIKANTNATITIQTVYLDPLSSNFAFGVKEVHWKAGDSTKLQQIWF